MLLVLTVPGLKKLTDQLKKQTNGHVLSKKTSSACKKRRESERITFKNAITQNKCDISFFVLKSTVKFRSF